MLCIITSILIILNNLNSVKTDDVKVNTKLGPIIGLTQIIDGKELYEFRGIRYAKPPINELRFKKPIPINKPWTEPVNATQWPNPCYQISTNSQFLNKNLSEDCLYLNVFAPKTNTIKPVVVFIHGGALIIGTSADGYNMPDLISIREDVIFVTINYRLNIFGFLYTGTSDGPGNVGLYD